MWCGFVSSPARRLAPEQCADNASITPFSFTGQRSAAGSGRHFVCRWILGGEGGSTVERAQRENDDSYIVVAAGTVYHVTFAFDFSQ